MTCFTTPTEEEESCDDDCEDETGESGEEEEDDDEEGSDEEEDDEEGDAMNCETECCFQGLEDCYDTVESMCGQNVKFRDCVSECEQVEGLGDVEEDDVDGCYDGCDKFYGECFEVEELLCEPCDDEDRKRKA